MIDQAVVDQIERCWWRGDSIKDTRASVAACFGVTVSFEQVHRNFVRLSHAHAAACGEKADDPGLYVRDVPDAPGPRWSMPSRPNLETNIAQFNVARESGAA